MSWNNVENDLEKLLQEAIEELDDRVINITERTVVNALEACDMDQNYAFLRGTLRSVLNRLLIFFLDNWSGVRGSFKDKIFLVATAPKSAAIIVSEVAKDTAAIRLTTRYDEKF